MKANELDTYLLIRDRISKSLSDANASSEAAKSRGFDANYIWRELMDMNLQMLLIELKMGNVFSVAEINSINSQTA